MTRVAALGISGSYSEEAAKSFFQDGCAIVQGMDFHRVLDAVRSGSAEYAVIPVRNTITGEITTSSELLASSGFAIFDRIEIPIRHILAGTPDSTVEEIRSVVSHPEALLQCSLFFHKNPEIRQVSESDTATGIRRIVEENKLEYAAIGSRKAAEAQGAKILIEEIADDPDNRTTFYLVGK